MTAHRNYLEIAEALATSCHSRTESFDQNVSDIREALFDAREDGAAVMGGVIGMGIEIRKVDAVRVIPSWEVSA